MNEDKSMDVNHYFIERGDGEPLILLHGNGEDCGYFQGQIDEFSKRFHVYAIDTRGHGKTPRGCKPFTIRQFAEMEHHFKDIEMSGRTGMDKGKNIKLLMERNGIQNAVYVGDTEGDE